MAYRQMGDARAQKPPYELTNGTDYWQETLYHLALQGAQDFLFFNPAEFQVEATASKRLSLAGLRFSHH